MSEKVFFVYIMTNTYNTVLYTGVTNNLNRRLAEHREKRNPKAFTSVYNIHKLVYFEVYRTAMGAIRREKQIKAGSRQNKIRLIESANKAWVNLF